MVPEPRGSLSNLTAKRVNLDQAKDSLSSGHALLAVHSVGLNFRDVLNVLGMYPGDPGNPGSDMAGVVTVARGAEVGCPNLAVGQRVFGLAHGCLGTVIAGAKTHTHTHTHTCGFERTLHACMSYQRIKLSCVCVCVCLCVCVCVCVCHTAGDGSQVVPVPGHLHAEEASTAPTVFVTVTAALQSVAGVQAGERVLVHAGTGGVGLAALQVRYKTRADSVDVCMHQHTQTDACEHACNFTVCACVCIRRCFRVWAPMLCLPRAALAREIC